MAKQKRYSDSVHLQTGVDLAARAIASILDMKSPPKSDETIAILIDLGIHVLSQCARGRDFLICDTGKYFDQEAVSVRDYISRARTKFIGRKYRK